MSIEKNGNHNDQQQSAPGENGTDPNGFPEAGFFLLSCARFFLRLLRTFSGSALSLAALRRFLNVRRINERNRSPAEFASNAGFRFREVDVVDRTAMRTSDFFGHVESPETVAHATIHA